MQIVLELRKMKRQPVSERSNARGKKGIKECLSFSFVAANELFAI
jgi:hypothetical protein